MGESVPLLGLADAAWSWCLSHPPCTGSMWQLSCSNSLCTLFACEMKCISFNFLQPHHLPDGFLTNSRTQLLNYFTYAWKASEENKHKINNGNWVMHFWAQQTPSLFQKTSCVLQFYLKKKSKTKVVSHSKWGNRSNFHSVKILNPFPI